MSNSTSTQFDCLIVGAGLIGLLSALELADAGLTVAVVDKGEAAQQASWAGGGILSPLPPWNYPDVVNLLAKQSQRLYPALCEQLHQQTGIDPQWWRCGLRVLNPSSAATGWLKSHGVSADVGEQSLLLPEVAQLRTPRLGQAVRAAVTSCQTIELIENQTVTRLLVSAGRCTGVQLKNGEVINATSTVIAAGAWSATLLPDEYWQPAIEPVRGQMLLYKPAEPLLTEVLLSDKHYLIPRRDGRVLIGSTLEPVGFDPSTTTAAATELQTAAERLLPALVGQPIERQWAGLRPGSPQGIPSIGPHPDIAGLHYNSGHYRNGVVLAPASAKLLTAQLTGIGTRGELAACLPDKQRDKAA